MFQKIFLQIGLSITIVFTITKKLSKRSQADHFANNQSSWCVEVFNSFSQKNFLAILAICLQLIFSGLQGSSQIDGYILFERNYIWKLLSSYIFLLEISYTALSRHTISLNTEKILRRELNTAKAVTGNLIGLNFKFY